jgi:hypothetical protein
MTASARVFTQLDLSASDNASSKIKGVRNELRSLNKQAAANSDTSHRARAALDEFGKAGDRTADTSGKLSTALSSLGDFAGSMEGDMRRASEAAGLLDDIMTVLPGPIGIAAGAIAGLGAVTTLFILEARKMRAAIDEVAVGPLADDVARLAGDLDLSKDAAAALAGSLQQTAIPAREVEGEVRKIVEQAERVGRDASADVLEFAKSLNSAAMQATRLEAIGRRIGVQKEKFGAFTFGLADEAADANRAADDAIESAQGTVRSIETAIRQVQGMTETGKLMSEFQVERLKELQALRSEAVAEARRVARVRDQLRADLREEERLREEDLAREYRTEAAKADRDRKRILADQAAAARGRRRGGTTTPQGGTPPEPLLSDDILQMAVQEEAQRASIVELKRKEAEATFEQVNAEIALARAKRDNLDRLVEEAKRIDEKREAEKRASGQTVEGYTAAGLAIAGTIAAQVKNERAANGLRAAIETAQALSNAGKFAATGNPGFLSASISHGAAAAIYAKNALGGGGSRGGGGGRAASGGGGAAGTAGGGQEGGGETTINVNFPGFVVGREADVAKQLKSLTAPLAGTGYGT